MRPWPRAEPRDGATTGPGATAAAAGAADDDAE
jgi:hypothetical protein